MFEDEDDGEGEGGDEGEDEDEDVVSVALLLLLLSILPVEDPEIDAVTHPVPRLVWVDETEDADALSIPNHHPTAGDGIAGAAAQVLSPPLPLPPTLCVLVSIPGITQLELEAALACIVFPDAEDEHGFVGDGSDAAAANTVNPANTAAATVAVAVAVGLAIAVVCFFGFGLPISGREGR